MKKISWLIHSVIYWPSTEPSIKRCTCIDKRKNSGSRWTLDNNITRCPDGSSQLEIRCRSESQRQTESFGPSVTHGWATPAKTRKKFCYGREKNLGQYVAVCPRLQLISLTQQTSSIPSRIKCERCIFIKNCVCSFIEVRIVFLIMFLLIFVLRLYNNRF